MGFKSKMDYEECKRDGFADSTERTYLRRAGYSTKAKYDEAMEEAYTTYNILLGF